MTKPLNQLDVVVALCEAHSPKQSPCLRENSAPSVLPSADMYRKRRSLARPITSYPLPLTGGKSLLNYLACKGKSDHEDLLTSGGLPFGDARGRRGQADVRHRRLPAPREGARHLRRSGLQLLADDPGGGHEAPLLLQPRQRASQGRAHDQPRKPRFLPAPLSGRRPHVVGRDHRRQRSQTAAARGRTKSPSPTTPRSGKSTRASASTRRGRPSSG